MDLYVIFIFGRPEFNSYLQFFHIVPQILHSTVTNAHTAGHQAIQAQEHVPDGNDTWILTLSLASPGDELTHPSY